MRLNSKRVALIGLTLITVGGLGVIGGMYFAPENWWFGRGVLFGPIYWLGIILLLLAGIMSLIERTRRNKANRPQPVDNEVGMKSKRGK